MLIASLNLFSQKVEISPSADTLDIGFYHQYIAIFDTVISEITIVKYEWSAISHSVIPGDNNISGDINEENEGFPYTSIPDFNNGSNPYQDTINVKWGDLNDPCEDDLLVRVYYKKSGNEAADPKTKSSDITLRCLKVPNIDGPNQIQDCCTDIVTYCEVSDGWHDEWEWNIQGGEIVSGNGTDCIDVIPDINGTLEVGVKISISSGLNEYFKESNLEINRFQPQTPDIEGPHYVCIGSSVELCVDIPCGGTEEVVWTIPNEFNIIGEENESCIIISPGDSIQGVSSFNISAQAIIDGGCTATVTNHSMDVYFSEPPPEPDGYVEIIFEAGYDPCDELFDTYYELLLHDNTPYTNGTTTTSSGIVIDVPHHGVTDRLEYTVCNYNYCSMEETCKTFLLFLPAPCDGEDPKGNLVQYNPQHTPHESTLNIQTKSKIVQYNQELNIDIFANQINNELIVSNKNKYLHGTIYVYNISGQLIEKMAVADQKTEKVYLPQKLKGVFFVHYVTPTGQFVKKIFL